MIWCGILAQEQVWKQVMSCTQNQLSKEQKLGDEVNFFSAHNASEA